MWKLKYTDIFLTCFTICVTNYVHMYVILYRFSIESRQNSAMCSVHTNHLSHFVKSNLRYHSLIKVILSGEQTTTALSIVCSQCDLTGKQYCIHIFWLHKQDSGQNPPQLFIQWCWFIAQHYTSRNHIEVLLHAAVNCILTIICKVSFKSRMERMFNVSHLTMKDSTIV